MGLGDSACTLLVFPWLGEVVGASLALGKALGQPLLALGAIVGSGSQKVRGFDVFFSK